MVAAAGPGAAVGGLEQGRALGRGKPGNEGRCGAAAVDGQDLLDDLGVLGRAQGCVP
ncbi:MAG TPA: hypothetical protein VMV92_02920 [Streptosporangiaceae bacterium]|nr:hypothetical protein [Streptosporangiaceae bacterium]